jgi:hypothetical protein
MLHPLASLWRYPLRVSFYEAQGVAGPALFAGRGIVRPYEASTARRFSSADEAANYLRYWLGEPDARAELKWMLQRSGPSLTSAQGGVDGWLGALAGRMVAGALVVVEENTRVAMPGRLVAPQSAADSASASIADLPPLIPAALAFASPADTPAANTEVAEPASPPSNSTPIATAPEPQQSAADQVAQAQALEQAAVNGTPFCEICEAAKKKPERT